MKFINPSQLDHNQPGTWPIYYQVPIWLLMMGLIWFLYNHFFREDYVLTQQSNQSEISQLQSDYEALYQYSLDLPLYLDKKKELTDKLYALLKYLPAETEMPNLIDETYKAAYKSDINFSQFTPEASIVKDYYNVEPISLSTTTGFINFAQFVQYIGELPRVLNVRSFDIDVDSQNAEALRVSSNLETYIYNQDITKLIGSEGDKQ